MIKRFWKEYKVIIIMFCVTILISLFLFLFIRMPKISGSSMEPTYYDGDRVVVFRCKNIKIGDIIVISSGRDDYIIKRVVGLPGDTLVINQSGFYRNGELVSESYLVDDNWFFDIESDVCYNISDDHVFVMGDNRRVSKDSRSEGAYDMGRVEGVVIFDFFK